MGRKALKSCPQYHPWDQTGLGRGPGRHFASSKISSLAGHLPCSLAPRWLPVLTHSFRTSPWPPPTPLLSATCCFPVPATPCSL